MCSSNKVEVARCIATVNVSDTWKAVSLLRAWGEGETGGKRGQVKSVTHPMEYCALDHLTSLVLQ